jgi:hypothetical protein
MSNSDVIVSLINPRTVNTALPRDGDKLIQLFDQVMGKAVEDGGTIAAFSCSGTQSSNT